MAPRLVSVCLSLPSALLASWNRQEIPPAFQSGPDDNAVPGWHRPRSLRSTGQGAHRPGTNHGARTHSAFPQLGLLGLLGHCCWPKAVRMAVEPVGLIAGLQS